MKELPSYSHIQEAAKIIQQHWGNQFEIELNVLSDTDFSDNEYYIVKLTYPTPGGRLEKLLPVHKHGVFLILRGIRDTIITCLEEGLSSPIEEMQKI